MCVQEYNKEKHGVDRYEQVLSFFTIISDGEHLQKSFVLVQSRSKHMLFMRKLRKTKQNFNWISLN
jgi:hypothetical protein